MVEHYVRILQAVSSKPDRKLSDLPMLSSEERERQLFEWNQTAAPYPKERCIPYVAPRNTIEEQIAAIWCRLLIVERVGVHDNFFELGGHSLKLLKLLDVLEKQVGLWLRVIDVLENPTVAGMAAKLQLSSRLNGPPIIIENFLVRLRAGGQKPLFIIPGGWGGENEMLVFSSMLPFLEKDMPVYGIFSRALDEAWPLPRDLRAPTAAVLKAIQHVEPHGPYIILGACIASPQAVEVAIQAESEGERPGSLILLDAAAFSRPPLLIAFLRRLGFDRLGWKRNKITTLTGDPVPARMANYFELLLNWNPAQFHSSLHLLFSRPLQILRKR